MRSWSDIPFSAAPFQQLENVGAYVRDVEERERCKAAAPVAEARFKLVNRLLNEIVADQILEIAAASLREVLKWQAIPKSLT